MLGVIAGTVGGIDPHPCAGTLIEAHALVNMDAEKYNMPANWKELYINNLHFTYEDEKHRTHHLEDVSIKLTRGETVAPHRSTPRECTEDRKRCQRVNPGRLRASMLGLETHRCL